MLAGVQLSDGLKLEAIADGGFSYAEIPYEIIEKDELPTYKLSLIHISEPTRPY
mgnify:CR=1 FL=1